jgi:gamma-glutamyltranspeptidase / glutathione hydrolase
MQLSKVSKGAFARIVVVATASAIAASGCRGAGHVAAQTPTPSSPTSSVAAAAPAPSAPAFPPEWPYPSGAAAPRSSRAMVVTDNALATKVGADVLAAGGNAVDAAVATAFAMAVAFPTAGNIGGGGFLVARVGGKNYALDFREVAPAAATRDMYLGADGKPTTDSRDGWRSSGVPGSVAGLWEAWHTLGSGKQTWADLITPAIKLADQGFVVDAPFDKSIEIVQARLAKYPATASLFLPSGAPPVVGSTWRDPDLANVLRRIAANDKGPSGFYEGPVAETIARAMKEGGGLVTKDDLKAYRAKWRTPVEFEYRGRTVVGMPPPSSGGVTTAMIAHLLAASDFHAMGWHSPAQIHLTAEAMRRAFAARNMKLGDPDFVKNPVDELLSDGWAAAQRATIQADRATPTKELFPNAPHGASDGPHTTHLGVVDADGNAVSMTTTINLWFGSGVTVPGLGFLLNDEMDDFATVPGTANAFGLIQGEPNAIAPGKRMLSSMSPTIVLGAGGIEAVLGAAGGSRIITAVFQELSNAVDFGMDASDAVRAPRFHQQDSPDILFLEPHGFPDDLRHALEAMGHATKEVDHLGDAPAIGRATGLWIGAAEPRRDGSLAAGL